YVEGTADRLFTAPAEFPSAARALLLGTCSLVLEPGASAYEALMREAAARGVLVAVDPNIRPGLIADPDAYRERFRSWLPSLSVVKLSHEDAEWLGGHVGDWLAAGPAAVVVTRGAAGMTVFTRDHEPIDVPGEPVDVVDTIGAGDTVYAALLHALAQRDLLTRAALAAVTPADWRRILGFSARASAITCTRAGAEPPYADEL
ncbi:MAG TPA: PfkB family carbohydrate kinase, partial [Thermomonospora sp.]|nr:PfkB family carbohydrate kinase [Thermomonospora sp.]